MVEPLAAEGDLELAEHRTAAAARALAGEPALRFRRHLVCVGSRIAPARAPYLHPEPSLATLSDLRGSTDGIALRLRHSSQRTYLEYLPEDSLAQLVYEFLEQFRVEALAPHSLAGVRANLRRRFDAWSNAYIASGLLENDLGLLVFTVVHVCRSRILAEPIPERVNDHTEATRAGIYQVLGQRLRDLRPAISEQAAFDEHAAAIAEAVAGLATASASSRSGGRAVGSLLSMLARDADREPDDPQSAGQIGYGSRVSARDDYTVFSSDFDRECSVIQLVNSTALAGTRRQLDEAVRQHRGIGAYLNRSAQQLFPAPALDAWESEHEEGLLDPRLLSRLSHGQTDSRIFRQQSCTPHPQAAVTLLIDCSGSMKGNIPQIAALADLLCRALDRVDVATEVLGFTTGAWNGGRPYRQWMGSGRPAHPGRMNEAHHIVFKDADTPWRKARKDISGLLWTPMFREGIDGEALQWAHGRALRASVARRYLLLVCDGSPMDSATALTNAENYLDHHLTAVADDIQARGLVRLFGLGIGHDMSAFLRESRIVDPSRILDPRVARTIVGWLAGE